MRDVLYGMLKMSRREEIIDPKMLRYTTSVNKAKLLHDLEPYIKTQVFKRHNDDAGYVESRIWMPYIRDEEIRLIETQLNYVTRECTRLEDRLKYYNDLSWFKKLFTWRI